MTDRLFERVVSDWLEEGSDRTPPAAMDAVLFAIQSTPQERALRIPRRFNPMPTYLRAAAVVAVVAIVGLGALTFLAQGPGVGDSSAAPPSPTPATSSASEAPVETGIPAMTQAFSSPEFGYDARYPAGWSVRPGTTQGTVTDLAILESGAGPARYWDHFGDNIAATTTVVPRDLTTDAWIEAYQAPQIAQAGRACIPEPATWEPITVDGRSGSIYVGCSFVEVLVFDGRRVYGFSYQDPAVPQSTVGTTGRELLEAFVATVTLHPERVSTPPPMPAGSSAPES